LAHSRPRPSRNDLGRSVFVGFPGWSASHLGNRSLAFDCGLVDELRSAGGRRLRERGLETDLRSQGDLIHIVIERRVDRFVARMRPASEEPRLRAHVS
jgi:hypothetical protein